MPYVTRNNVLICCKTSNVSYDSKQLRAKNMVNCNKDLNPTRRSNSQLNSSRP